MFERTYLNRYVWPGGLRCDWNRWWPPGPRTLYVSRRWSKDRRHSRWDGHSNRYRAHRVPHSGVRQGWRRMSMMNRGRWSSSSLRMRWARGTERGRGPVLARHVRPARPATPWPAFSMGFRRRLRHLFSAISKLQRPSFDHLASLQPNYASFSCFRIFRTFLNVHSDEKNFLSTLCARDTFIVYFNTSKWSIEMRYARFHCSILV